MAGLEGFVRGWANHLIPVAEDNSEKHPGGEQSSSQWSSHRVSNGFSLEGAQSVGLDQSAG